MKTLTPCSRGSMYSSSPIFDNECIALPNTGNKQLIEMSKAL